MPYMCNHSNPSRNHKIRNKYYTTFFIQNICVYNLHLCLGKVIYNVRVCSYKKCWLYNIPLLSQFMCCSCIVTDCYYSSKFDRSLPMLRAFETRPIVDVSMYIHGCREHFAEVFRCFSIFFIEKSSRPICRRSRSIKFDIRRLKGIVWF